MERVGRPISTGELLGDFPFGRPSRCLECGQEAEKLRTPAGREYYQLRCECQRRKVYNSAKRYYDAAVSSWGRAVGQIVRLEAIPKKDRDEGAWADAWGQAKRSARTAQEYAAAFGFRLPDNLDAWGLEVFGPGWGQ